MASGTVRLCHSAIRLVRVCLIISCLASRSHRVSMTMVWRAFRTKRSSFAYAYYSNYKKGASIVTQFCMAGGCEGECACAANWHPFERARFLVGGSHWFMRAVIRYFQTLAIIFIPSAGYMKGVCCIERAHPLYSLSSFVMSIVVVMGKRARPQEWCFVRYLEPS